MWRIISVLIVLLSLALQRTLGGAIYTVPVQNSQPRFIQGNLPPVSDFLSSGVINKSPSSFFNKIASDSRSDWLQDTFDPTELEINGFQPHVKPPSVQVGKLYPLQGEVQIPPKAPPGLHGNDIIRKADAIASGIYRSDYDSRYGGAPAKRTKCQKRAASYHYNLTDVMYDYPEENIFTELHSKPTFLLDIYKSRQQNKVKSPEKLKTFDAGCKERISTLEGFWWKERRCWVLYPRHQNVQFVRCVNRSCSRKTRGSHCSARDVIKTVWAYCNALPDGQRVTKMEVPLSDSCQCGASSC